MAASVSSSEGSEAIYGKFQPEDDAISLAESWGSLPESVQDAVDKETDAPQILPIYSGATWNGGYQIKYKEAHIDVGPSTKIKVMDDTAEVKSYSLSDSLVWIKTQPGKAVERGKFGRTPDEAFLKKINDDLDDIYTKYMERESEHRIVVQKRNVESAVGTAKEKDLPKVAYDPMPKERPATAHSGYYNNLDYRSLFDDSVPPIHHYENGLQLAQVHSNGHEDGEYYNGLILGGVIGGGSTVAILVLFCIGVAFGMLVCFGYQQKKALDERKKEDWRQD
eukprot:224412_1